MNTLIVYSSKYDFTKERVLEIANSLKFDVKVVNINKEKPPGLEAFDTVILGGSVFMGQINKALKNYCQENETTLNSKKLALFLSCGLPDNVDTHLSNAYPKSLLDHASVKVNLGGELRLDKMSFGDKMITKMMIKATEKEGGQLPTANPSAIEELVRTLN
jgi:menaquinone-dependent protoporphyrinogen oxidase